MAIDEGKEISLHGKFQNYVTIHSEFLAPLFFVLHLNVQSYSIWRMLNIQQLKYFKQSATQSSDF